MNVENYGFNQFDTFNYRIKTPMITNSNILTYKILNDNKSNSIENNNCKNYSSKTVNYKNTLLHNTSKINVKDKSFIIYNNNNNNNSKLMKRVNLSNAVLNKDTLKENFDEVIKNKKSKQKEIFYNTNWNMHMKGISKSILVLNKLEKKAKIIDNNAKNLNSSRCDNYLINNKPMYYNNYNINKYKLKKEPIHNNNKDKDKDIKNITKPKSVNLKNSIKQISNLKDSINAINYLNLKENIHKISLKDRIYINDNKDLESFNNQFCKQKLKISNIVDLIDNNIIKEKNKDCDKILNYNSKTNNNYKLKKKKHNDFLNKLYSNISYKQSKKKLTINENKIMLPSGKVRNAKEWEKLIENEYYLN